MSDSITVTSLTTLDGTSLPAFAVHGAFDFMDTHLDAEVDGILRRGITTCAIDLSHTTHLTAMGVASIIKTVKKMQNNGGALVIHGATSDMIDLLNMGNLGKYLRFSPSLEQSAPPGVPPDVSST